MPCKCKNQQMRMTLSVDNAILLSQEEALRIALGQINYTFFLALIHTLQIIHPSEPVLCQILIDCIDITLSSSPLDKDDLNGS